MHINRPIGIMVKMCTTLPGDMSSIPGQVLSKTRKMVLAPSLLNTQHYKVWIKGKWSNPGKRVTPSPVIAIEKGAFGTPSTTINGLF